MIFAPAGKDRSTVLEVSAITEVIVMDMFIMLSIENSVVISEVNGVPLRAKSKVVPSASPLPVMA